MSVQGMLFARDEISQPPPPKVGAGIHPDCKNLAFLYTATETGTNSGIRFMLTVEEAKTWCNWEGSKGRFYKTEWAYFWTSVWNFILHHSGDAAVYGHEPAAIDISRITDNGEWDDRIAALGLTKIGYRQFATVLEPLGVKVITTAQREDT